MCSRHTSFTMLLAAPSAISPRAFLSNAPEPSCPRYEVFFKASRVCQSNTPEHIFSMRGVY